MKSFKLQSLFLFLVLAFGINGAANAAYTCVGKVAGLSIGPKDGAVIVAKLGALEWAKLCSIKTVLNGVDVETCKVIYSALLTAQVTDKNVRLWFNDDGDCSTSSHAPWSELTGWYFGPKLED